MYGKVGKLKEMLLVVLF